MAKAPPGAGLQVTVAWSPGPRKVVEQLVRLPEGAILADALVAAGVVHPVVPADVALGIWGDAATAATPLTDGDRVEIYRPLRVDPKVARRERFAGQGRRAAGLFAKKR